MTCSDSGQSSPGSLGLTGENSYGNHCSVVLFTPRCLRELHKQDARQDLPLGQNAAASELSAALLHSSESSLKPQLPEFHGRKQGTASNKGCKWPGSHSPSPLSSILSCGTSCHLSRKPPQEPLPQCHQLPQGTAGKDLLGGQPEVLHSRSPAFWGSFRTCQTCHLEISALLKGTNLQVENSRLLTQGMASQL